VILRLRIGQKLTLALATLLLLTVAVAWVGVSSLGGLNARTRALYRDNIVNTEATIAEIRAATDALTGLPNNRAVQDTIRRMVAQASRSVMPLSAALLDLDHFKRATTSTGTAAATRSWPRWRPAALLGPGQRLRRPPRRRGVPHPARRGAERDTEPRTG
jgi:predicted signal transduction protein with EAL and GGDEF domain